MGTFKDVTLTLAPVCECGYVFEELKLLQHDWGIDFYPNSCPNCKKKIGLLLYRSAKGIKEDDLYTLAVFDRVRQQINEVPTEITFKKDVGWSRGL